MRYDSIDNILNEVVVDLKKNVTINEIRLFGSQVYEHKVTSDIDLFIECSNDEEYEIIIKKISEISCKYKLFIHPVIFTKKLVTMNQYYKINIMDNSIILFSKSMQYVV
jgi:predicted nucleotidyltransferase